MRWPLMVLFAVCSLLASSQASFAASPTNAKSGSHAEALPPCPITQECLETADVLWQPDALTAIGKLPATRVVVFDPVTNSFAFVASTRDTNGQVDPNLAMLDRRRMALTTQKIRLLIMPYNPYDGSLSIESSYGTGVEIDDIVSPPSSTSTSAPATTTPVKAKKTAKATKPRVSTAIQPPKPKAKPAVHSARAAAGKATATSPSQFDLKVKAAQEKVGTPEFTSSYKQAIDMGPEDLPQAEELVRIGGEEFDSLALKVSGLLRNLQGSADCATDHVRQIPLQISGKFVQKGFTLSHDTTFHEIEQAAAARRAFVLGISYEPCIPQAADPNRRPLDIEVEHLQEKWSEIAEGLDTLQQHIAQQSRAVDFATLEQKTAKSDDPAGWADWLAEWKQQLKDEQAYVTEAAAELKDRAQEITALTNDAEKFQQAIDSPALAIQRFNFTPLRVNQSLTLKVKRGTISKEDDSLTIRPDNINTMTLLSAPAYRIRFGIGVVGSTLANPTFKAGMNTAGKRVILEDGGQADVFPGVFVYHHWGFRAPLLQSTWFEKLTPTFSLGLPLTKSDVLQEFLLGLNWQLAPGFGFDVGCHIGQVSSLATGSVGGVIDSKVDVTTLQQKRFGAGFYAGIVLNAETFKGLQGMQQ